MEKQPINSEVHPGLCCPIGSCGKPVQVKIYDNEPDFEVMIDGAALQCGNEFYSHYDNGVLIKHTKPNY